MSCPTAGMTVDQLRDHAIGCDVESCRESRVWDLWLIAGNARKAEAEAKVSAAKERAHSAALTSGVARLLGETRARKTIPRDALLDVWRAAGQAAEDAR